LNSSRTGRPVPVPDVAETWHADEERQIRQAAARRGISVAKLIRRAALDFAAES